MGLCHPSFLNHFAAFWFTATITGVFYHGITHILPVVYEGYPDWFFYLHYLLIFIMFTEMMVNFAFVKFLKSSFLPEKYADVPSNQEMASEAVEVKLNGMKPFDGNYYSLDIQSSEVQNKMRKGVTYMAPHNLQQGGAKVSQNGTTEEKSGYKVVYPYFAWKPCIICQKPRPPRTHHCPLCGTCVLKRDHHCFFAGTCIGLRNQRHFVVFSFWASLGTTYCFVHSTVYLFTYLIPHTTYWDAFLPFTLVRWVFGYTPSLFLILILLYYSVIWFWLTSMAFVYEQTKCILQGMTSFEKDNSVKLTNIAGREERIKAVFGDHWKWNFILPLHWGYPPGDDGVHWPHIRNAYYH